MGWTQMVKTPTHSRESHSKLVVTFVSLLLSGSLFLYLGCAKSEHDELTEAIELLPQYPDSVVADDAPAEVLLSSVEIPLELQLGPAIEALETAVPRVHDRMGAWTYHGNNARYKFRVERDRFAASLSGNTLELATTLRYGAVGQYRPLGFWISGSCGVGGAAPRRIAVAYRTVLGMNSNWTLRPTTTISRLVAVDECRVTVLSIDVTDKVIRVFRDPIDRGAQAMNDRIASLNVRSKLEQVWQQLQTPIPFGDGALLRLNPLTLRFAGVQGTGTTLTTSIGLTITPQIVLGKEQYAEEEVLALPDNSSDTVGSGFHVVVEGALSYTRATQYLKNELVGQQLKASGHSVEITDVQISGAGRDRLVMRVNFQGDARGHVYLVGRPQYDSTAQQITLSDFDYDVHTSSLLVRVFAWLKHEEIRSTLTQRAVWNVVDDINRARENLAEALNRDLGGGFLMSGEVYSVEALGAHVGPSGIRFRARADGVVRVTGSVLSE